MNNKELRDVMNVLSAPPSFSDLNMDELDLFKDQFKLIYLYSEKYINKIHDENRARLQGFIDLS